MGVQAGGTGYAAGRVARGCRPGLQARVAGQGYRPGLQARVAGLRREEVLEEEGAVTRGLQPAIDSGLGLG